MSVLFLLIGVSLTLSALFVVICILSIRGGQFDDLESPKWRAIFSAQGKNHLLDFKPEKAKEPVK